MVFSMVLTLGLLAQGGPGLTVTRTTALDRALAYLGRERARWPQAHRCFSCHDSADASRALFLSRSPRRGLRNARPSLDQSPATIDWLLHPERWDQDQARRPAGDPRLARISMTCALAAGVQSGWIEGRSALRQAALALENLQSVDGSWPIEGVDDIGSPVTLGRPLATLLCRDALALADAPRHRTAITRANAWLDQRPIATVIDAAVALLAQRPDQPPSPRLRDALKLIQRGQAEDGGWGPRVLSPPEIFDSSVVLLGLARVRDRNLTDPMIRRGRGFLEAHQTQDGSWDETTRPPGVISHAQRVSTTAWAALALAAAQPVSEPSPQSQTPAPMSRSTTGE